MEPVGVSRKLALMPAGHANGRADSLRSAISIRKYPDIRHAEIDARADGEKSHKCGKTHIFAAWALAGLEGRSDTGVTSKEEWTDEQASIRRDGRGSGC